MGLRPNFGKLQGAHAGSKLLQPCAANTSLLCIKHLALEAVCNDNQIPCLPTGRLQPLRDHPVRHWGLNSNTLPYVQCHPAGNLSRVLRMHSAAIPQRLPCPPWWTRQCGCH
jgi:hypothetical protein